MVEGRGTEGGRVPGTEVVGIWLQKMFHKWAVFKYQSRGFRFLCNVCGLFLLKHSISSKLVS